MRRRETKRYLYIHNGQELEVWGKDENEALATLRAYGYQNVNALGLSEIKATKTRPIE